MASKFCMLLCRVPLPYHPPTFASFVRAQWTCSIRALSNIFCHLPHFKRIFWRVIFLHTHLTPETETTVKPGILTAWGLFSFSPSRDDPLSVYWKYIHFLINFTITFTTKK
jgi:hypothetical protein